MEQPKDYVTADERKATRDDPKLPIGWYWVGGIVVTWASIYALYLVVFQ